MMSMVLGFCRQVIDMPNPKVLDITDCRTSDHLALKPVAASFKKMKP